MKYGLLGRKLGHSFSKEIHAYLGDYDYELFERQADEIKDLILDENIGGLNVTIPYKEEAMKYCHSISPRARSIGCINTIYKNTNNELVGDNTDYHGFSYILDQMDLDLGDKFTIILANGATSKTVASVLENRGGTYIKLSRSQAPFLSDIDKYRDADIIINTSPVGMYPNVGESLVDLAGFRSLKAVIDVVYNPPLTKLLKDARDMGIPYSNGLSMLVVQAARASELFTGNKIGEDRIREIIREINEKISGKYSTR